jgi:hypothetical protein
MFDTTKVLVWFGRHPTNPRFGKFMYGVFDTTRARDGLGIVEANIQPIHGLADSRMVRGTQLGQVRGLFRQTSNYTMVYWIHVRCV